ncbi:hypothetical protein RB195_020035 [Necator americanus]|uniref:Uncharacterized protein n=1 Tax=Necator americanus TaxID=51031 RepID=A0ABR1CJQ7_NECAM
MDLENDPNAAVLKYLGNGNSSNIVHGLDSREKNGGRRSRLLSRNYRAEITLSKLKFCSQFIGYDYKTLRWEEYEMSREPFDFIGSNGAFLGLSCDSTYLVALRLFRSEAILYFLELSPTKALQRNFLLLTEIDTFTRIRIYFQQSNRFISSFIYNQSDLISAYENGLSESSTFLVVTVFPDLMLRLSLSSSATIVRRKSPKGDGVMRKDYLRIHANGFVLNTGVTLLMILFSETAPAKLKYMQKIWRVIKQDKGPVLSGKSHSVSADLGEEIRVDASVVQENEFEGMSYRLVDCDSGSFNDPKEYCGLRRPLFVSRHVVCIESLIDRAVIVFIRRSKLFKGACYKGSRDYETDISYVDDQGVCKIITVCVCEVQIPLNGDGDTKNVFYLCRVDTSWSVFRGWIPGGTCRILKELPHVLAFNPRAWYPYARFPVERDGYAYNVANKVMFCEQPQRRLTSYHGDIDVILDCID